MTVRVLRGSADRGREFAALQFTNTGSRRCQLAGYPTVTLLRCGGSSSAASRSRPSTGPSAYTLAPGDTAESKLNDYTTCNAPLSDQIRVVAPGSTQSPRPARSQLRGVHPAGRPARRAGVSACARIGP